MTPSADLGPLRAAATAALGLVRRTTSGRLALAQAAGVVDPAMLPAPMLEQARAELADALARSAEPLGARDVEKLLRAAWGDKPSAVLDDFDAAPVAVTPGAQVHRGQHDGSPVAVKVLRPGITEIVRADLATAQALAAPLGAALPTTDAGALLAEIRERVMDELDLEHEGQALRTFARALRDAEAAGAPRPVSELTHPGVLVSGWADGTPLAEAARLPSGAEGEQLARRLVGALATAARTGIVHADPGPANVLLAKDGTVAFVDLGATARIPPERFATALGALRAFTDGDDDACAHAIAELGWLDHAAALRAIALGRDLAAPFLNGPATLDPEAMGAMADAAAARLDEVAALAGAVRVQPQDLWPLRGIGTLVATLARLRVTADWPALVLEAADQPS